MITLICCTISVCRMYAVSGHKRKRSRMLQYRNEVMYRHFPRGTREKLPASRTYFVDKSVSRWSLPLNIHPTPKSRTHGVLPPRPTCSLILFIYDILWINLRCSQYTDYVSTMAGCMMNCKGSLRNRPCPRRGTIPEIAWKYWGKPRKIFSQDIRCPGRDSNEHLPNTNLQHYCYATPLCSLFI